MIPTRTRQKTLLLRRRTLDSAKGAGSSSSRLLKLGDLEGLKKGLAVKCLLCVDRSRQFSEASSLVKHLRSDHSRIIRAPTAPEHEFQLIFRSKLKAETGSDLEGLRFLSDSCVRCPSCNCRVILQAPYSAKNLVRHMEAKKCGEKRQNGLRESVKRRLSEERAKSGPPPSKVQKQTTPNSTVSSESLDPQEAVQKAVTLYRYLANCGNKIFLSRNLSYMRPYRAPKTRQKTERPLETPGPSKDRREDSLVVELESIADRSSSASSINADVTVYLFRCNCNNPVEKFQLEEKLIVGSEQKVGSCGVAVNRQTRRRLVFDRNVLQPLNGHKEWSSWLLFHVRYQKEPDCMTNSGRALRNVPLRRSILAQQEATDGRLRRKSDSPKCAEKQILELFACCFLGSASKTWTKDRILSLPLVEFEEGSGNLGKKGAVILSTVNRLRTLVKKSESDQTASPHLKLSIRADDDGADSDDDEEKGNVNLISASSAHSSLSQKDMEKQFPLPKRLLYRFFYDYTSSWKNHGDRLSFPTEASAPSKCPFCNCRCWNVWCLLRHLRTSHSRLHFLYREPSQPDELPVIEVKPNPHFDWSFEGRNLRQFLPTAIPLPAPRQTFTELIVWRPTERHKKPSLDEFKLPEKSRGRWRKEGHVRQYFHSHTLGPVTTEEDSDSESENYAEWTRLASCRQIDDYADVNSGEKQLMMRWNLFAMRNEVLSNRQVMSACETFLRAEWGQLDALGLRRNLLLHLASLVAQGKLHKTQYRALVQTCSQMALLPAESSGAAQTPSSRKEAVACLSLTPLFCHSK